MLTLSDEWRAAFERSNVEPVVSVTIDDGTTTYRFCMADRPFQSSVNGTIPNNIIGLTNITSSLDPVNRGVTRSDLTVEIADDQHFRDILTKPQYIRNQRVIVKLGAHSIASEANFAPFFRGYVGEYLAREGVIQISVKEIFGFISGRPWFGTLINRHPLEAIEKLLEDIQVPTEWSNSDSLDPTDAANADISHYNLTVSRMPALAYNNGVQADYDGPSGVDFSRWALFFRNYPESYDTLAFCQEIIRNINGCLFPDEDGKAAFAHFNTAGASVRDWDADTIREFAMVSNVEEVINTIHMTVSRGIGTENQPAPLTLTMEDATSQGNYVYPGSVSMQEPIAMDFSTMVPEAEILGGLLNASATTMVLVGDVTGFTGARDGYPSGSQPTANKISGSKLGWFAIHSINSDGEPQYEIVKCTAATFDDDSVIYSSESELDTLMGPYVAYPGKMTCTIARAQYGTTAVVHRLNYEESWIVNVPVVQDITQAIDYGEGLLTRFAHGIRIVRVTTGLGQYDVQIGDVVTLTNDIYASYNKDGLDDNTTWEVVGKEAQASQGSIAWTLAHLRHASESKSVSFGGFHVITDYVGPYGNPKVVDAHAAGGAAVNHGLGVSAGSGLALNIGAGSSSVGGAIARRLSNGAVTLTASKDCYVEYLPKANAFYIQQVANDAAEPAPLVSGMPIGKVVTGGSAISSVVDRRRFGHMGLKNLDLDQIGAGHNMVFNPSFDTWTRGSNAPPDSWDLAAGTWNTDAAQEATAVKHGNHSLKISTTSGQLDSQTFPVTPNKLYRFGGWVRASSTSTNLRLTLYWLDVDKVLVSTDSPLSGGLTAADTWYEKILTRDAPATAHYAKFVCSRAITNTGDAFYDGLFFEPAYPYFLAYRNAGQTLTKATVVKVGWDTIEVDRGGHFDESSNNRFDAPQDGTYQFTSQVKVTVSGAVTGENPLIILKVNGSIKRNGIYSGPPNNGNPNPTTSWQFYIDSGLIELSAGDYVEIFISNTLSADFTIVNNALDTYFTGRLIT